MERVRSTLKKIDGVVKHDVDAKERLLVVTFDDKRTSVTKIVGQLAEGGYTIAGKPEILH